MTRFSEKTRQYMQFGEQTSMNILPFIMSTHGVVHKNTLELLREWSSFVSAGPIFMNDLLQHAQAELIRGQRHGLLLLLARWTSNCEALAENKGTSSLAENKPPSSSVQPLSTLLATILVGRTSNTNSNDLIDFQTRGVALSSADCGLLGRHGGLVNFLV
jgi:hypothetical protein